MYSYELRGFEESVVVCANIAKHILNNIYIPTPHLLSIIAATLNMKYKK